MEGVDELEELGPWITWVQWGWGQGPGTGNRDGDRGWGPGTRTGTRMGTDRQTSLDHTSLVSFIFNILKALEILCR